MDTIMSIPYHLASLGGRILGLDAYFWNTLSLAYRKVILVRSADSLREEPEGCVLEARVSVEEQYRDLVEISKSPKALPEASRKGLPLSILKLTSFVIPYRIAEIAWRHHVNSMILDEPRAASIIASQVLALGSWKPLGIMKWLVVTARGNGVDVKALDYLRGVDAGFSLALREAITKCKGGGMF